MKRKLLNLFFALIVSEGSVFAADVIIDGIRYNLDIGHLTAEVTGATDYNSGGIVIPSSVTYNAQTYSVTRIGNKAFKETILTSVEIPNSVTSIGEWAFNQCKRLTSVEIPNSVTSIEYAAFSANGLRSVTIGNGVTSIGNNAFNNCYSLNSVTMGNSVTDIGQWAFLGCRALSEVIITDIGAWCNINFYDESSNPLSIAHHLYYNYEEITNLIIPNNVTNIGNYAFYSCLGLNSVTIPRSVTSVGNKAFYGCDNLTDIYAICGDIDRVTQLLDNDVRIKSTLPIITTNATNGTVSLMQDNCDVLLTAVPNDGYHFTQWSDGITDNPRSVIFLTSDTTFTAEFATDKSGTCGKDNALTWSYEEQSKTLTITGNGELTDNYTFGLDAPMQMKTLIIGDGVTAIGDRTFYETKTLNHLFIGANVASIGDYTFAECKNFDDITCYATTVPTVNATTFENVGNKKFIYLYSPGRLLMMPTPTR